jgi:hypothetical protein
MPSQTPELSLLPPLLSSREDLDNLSPTYESFVNPINSRGEGGISLEEAVYPSSRAFVTRLMSGRSIDLVMGHVMGGQLFAPRARPAISSKETMAMSVCKSVISHASE